MKKRNLFLSLISSIILTVALVAVTVASVFAPSKNAPIVPDTPSISDPGHDLPTDPTPDINEGRDGSEENPYILYSAENFVEMMEEYGDKALNFELNSDIDFAGYDFKTLAKENAFNGKLDGKNFALKNIKIDVTKENLIDFAAVDKDEKYVANIAIFAKSENAVIENLVIDGLEINVDGEVYSYIRDGGFNADNERAIKQITIASLVAMATSTNVTNAEINATINAGAYAIYADNKVDGWNAVGGVFAVANHSNIYASKVNAKLNATEGSRFYAGAVAGYAYNSDVDGVEIAFDVAAKYDQIIYLAGVAGYTRGANISNTIVDLKVTEAGERYNAEESEVSEFTSIGGIVNTARVDIVNSIGKLEAQTLNIDNVEVKADIDMDVVFAGAMVEVRNAVIEITDKNPNAVLVNVNNFTLNANVNVAEVYGLAKVAYKTIVAFDKENEDGCHIKIVGNAEKVNCLVSTVAHEAVRCASGKTFKGIKVVLGENLYHMVSELNSLELVQFSVANA